MTSGPFCSYAGSTLMHNLHAARGCYYEVYSAREWTEIKVAIGGGEERAISGVDIHPSVVTVVEHVVAIPETIFRYVFQCAWYANVYGVGMLLDVVANRVNYAVVLVAEILRLAAIWRYNAGLINQLDAWREGCKVGAGWQGERDFLFALVDQTKDAVDAELCDAEVIGCGVGAIVAEICDHIVQQFLSVCSQVSRTLQANREREIFGTTL